MGRGFDPLLDKVQLLGAVLRRDSLNVEMAHCECVCRGSIPRLGISANEHDLIAH